MRTTAFSRIIVTALALVAIGAAQASAQVIQRQGVPDSVAAKLPVPPPPPPEPNYIIGVDDVLAVTVYGDAELSGDVVVRPDGKISLKYGNEIVASGLTTEELKAKVTEEMKRFREEPTVFIQVKAINSRKVFIDGAVNKPGAYILSGPMTVANAITAAGGLQEFADKKNITVISATLKNKDGSPFVFKVNYADIEKGKNVAKNNIQLRPGDQIIVPQREVSRSRRASPRPAEMH
jgi:polysaccharide export outer membrane protein